MGVRKRDIARLRVITRMGEEIKRERVVIMKWKSTGRGQKNGEKR